MAMTGSGHLWGADRNVSRKSVRREAGEIGIAFAMNAPMGYQTPACWARHPTRTAQSAGPQDGRRAISSPPNSQGIAKLAWAIWQARAPAPPARSIAASPTASIFRISARRAPICPISIATRALTPINRKAKQSVKRAALPASLAGGRLTASL